MRLLLFPFSNLLILAALLTTGCAVQPPSGGDRAVGEAAGFVTLSPDPQGGQHRVWPSPPDQARYRYIGQITGEDNLPRKPRSAFKKALAWLVGLGSRRLEPRELQRPQAIHIDEAAGRLYVTDVSRGAIYVFDDALGQLHIWEDATGVAEGRLRFESPVGIVGLGDGSLLVSDSRLGRIVRLSADGVPLGEFAAGEVTRPTGMAFDRESGLVFVADRAENRIRVFDESGKPVRSFGEFGEAEGQFNGPTHLHFAHNSLYVSDTLNARVQQFDRNGKYLRSIGRRGLFVGNMPRPKGVATDRHGHVYVLESYYDYLLIFSDKGEFLLPLGGTGSGVGEFYLPAGIRVDSRDRVFIVDGFNGRIVILQYLGQA